MSVEFSYIRPATIDEPKVSRWIQNVVEEHEGLLGEIFIQFVSDEHLLEINRESLDHDYYTDIITFDYVAGELISGDLFISVDRVGENAAKIGASFDYELHRVIIHGVLHLIGYADKTEEDSADMREAEDDCLKMLFEK